jgi:nitroreductase
MAIMPEKARRDGKEERTGTGLRVGPLFTPFASKALTDDCLARVIEVAHHAPSELSFQPWRWIVVRSEPGRQHLESSAYIKVPLSTAPIVLICLSDTNAWKAAPEHLRKMVAQSKLTDNDAREALNRIREYYSVSPQHADRAALANGFIALHQMLLAAAECDLQAYWVTEFDEPKVKSYFHIPDQFLVAALLAIGYHEESSPPTNPALPLQALVYEEKFGETFHDLAISP